MYVCICESVTEEELREVIEAGAHTLKDVMEACNAGAYCGSCRGRIIAMIEEVDGVP